MMSSRNSTPVVAAVGVEDPGQVGAGAAHGGQRVLEVGAAEDRGELADALGRNRLA